MPRLLSGSYSRQKTHPSSAEVEVQGVQDINRHGEEGFCRSSMKTVTPQLRTGPRCVRGAVIHIEGWRDRTKGEVMIGNVRIGATRGTLMWLSSGSSRLDCWYVSNSTARLFGIASYPAPITASFRFWMTNAKPGSRFTLKLELRLKRSIHELLLRMQTAPPFGDR